MFSITADRQVIGVKDSPAFVAESINRAQFSVVSRSVNTLCNRYNDNFQGANGDKTETEKAWLRWCDGRCFDSSDESFYSC